MAASEPLAAQDADAGEFVRRRLGEDRRPIGCLYVRCVGAFDLASGDKRVFHTESSDPFAVIKLQESSAQCGYESSRRTHTCAATLSPMWKEEFRFGIHADMHQDMLHLQIEVWDDNGPNEQADFLGQASIPLKPVFQGTKSREWHGFHPKLGNRDVETNTDKYIDATGQVHVTIGWEPWGGMRWFSHLGTLRRSRRASSMVGFTFLSSAGFVLMVTHNMRLLCRGEDGHDPDLSDCQNVVVASASACVLISSILSFFASIVHLMGGIGCLGRDWTCGPPRVFDMLEDPDDEEEQLDMCFEAAKEMAVGGLQVDVAHQGLTKHDVVLGNSLGFLVNCLFRSKSSCVGLRLIAWMLQFVAFVLPLLAIFLAEVNSAEKDYFGEAYYLIVLALLLKLLGALYLVFAGRAFSEENTWRHGHTVLKSSRSLSKSKQTGRLQRLVDPLLNVSGSSVGKAPASTISSLMPAPAIQVDQVTDSILRMSSSTARTGTA